MKIPSEPPHVGRFLNYPGAVTAGVRLTGSDGGDMAKAAGTTRTPPDLDSDLTLEDLIAFGRDYLKEIEANEAIEASARIPIDLPLNVLKKYPARSIDGLVLLQAEQARKTPKKSKP